MSPKATNYRYAWIVFATLGVVLGGGRLWAGESPWYVAARLGEASAEAQLGARHPQHVDDEASSAAVEIGYELNRHLAVEVGYLDLGSHGGVGSPCRQSEEACIERLASLGLCVEGFECAEIALFIDAELSGFSVALVPRLPLGDRLALRGKLGLISWDGDVSAPGFGAIETFSGEELLAGVGLQYSFPGGLGLLLQHEEQDLDVGSTSLGVSWRF